MTISRFDRVYVSCFGEYGRVAEIIPTGIVGIVKYRVEFAAGRSGIYGAAFVQRAACQSEPPLVREGGNVVALPRGRAALRLVVSNGAVLA